MDEYLKTWFSFMKDMNSRFDTPKYYELTLEELTRLCRDFQADCHDGFVSNDKSYIELWLKKNIKDDL